MVYEQLLTERERLADRLRRREEASVTVEENSQTDSEELAGLRPELARLREREKSLEEQLRLVESELAGYRRRELVMTDLVESVKRTAAKTKAEALVESSKMLKKARRHEARIVRNASAEASNRLQEAKQREAQVVKEAELELDRVEAERQRLHKEAEELRQDLSTVLLSTLEQLTVTLPVEDSAIPSQTPVVADVEGVAEAEERKVGETVSATRPEPIHSPSLAESIRARILPGSTSDHEE